MRTSYDLQNFIAENISNRRNELDITLEQLSSETGLRISKLEKLETGNCKISSYDLFLLSKALGAPIGYFFPDDERVSFVIPTESNFILTTYGQLDDAGKNSVLKYLGELKLQSIL